MSRVLRGAATLALLLCAACDDSHVVTPKPPGPSPPCAELDDFLHTIAVARPPGSTVDATAAGTLAFLANGSDGIVVADFSSSAEAVVVGAVGSLIDARAVDVEGTLVLVANGKDGVAVVDVGNPSAPQVMGTATMPGDAVDVDAAGSLAFVANDVIGMVIVDVSNPAAPAIRGIENTPGKAVGVTVAPNDALTFVADETLGVRVVNTADPDAPFLIHALVVPGTAQAVAYDGGVVAVAAREAGLVLVAPAPAGGVAGQLDMPAEAFGVALADGIAFVADGTGGVVVVDVGDPTNPRTINVLGAISFVQDVAVAAGRLITADAEAGARVVGIGRAQEPPADAPAGILDARAVAPLGGLAVVVDVSYGVRVVDPIAGGVIGELAIEGTPVDVYMVDSLAYVNTVDAGVVIADLRDPSTPSHVGAVPDSRDAQSVAVDDPFIYLVRGFGTVSESRLDGTGFPRGFAGGTTYFSSLALDDDFVYLPGIDGNVWLVDRATMNLAAVLPVGGSAERIVIRYEESRLGLVPRVMVAVSGLINGQTAIETWDFTTLFDPKLVARVMCDGNAVDVAFDDDWMVVAEGDDGCQVFDLRGGGVPRPIGHLAGPAPRVAVVGDRIAIAAGTRGLRLVPPTGCLE